MNNYKLILLWRPRFRLFHLRGRNYSVMVNNSSGSNNNNARDYDGWYRSTTINSNFNGECWNINRHHHRLLLLRLTFKANSHQRFCTSTTTTSTMQSSDQTVNKLPDSIDQQCEQWEQIFRAEWEATVAEEHSWHDVKLKCIEVLPVLKTTKLLLSAANLSLEQWRRLRQSFQIGENVELKNLSQTGQKQSDSIGPLDNILGIVTRHYPDRILIRIHRRLNIQEAQLIQRCSFDIRKIENPRLLENRLNFLGKRHSDWHKLPGYATMLQAFKCQPLPETTGLDPVDWVGSHGKDLDPSQCQALGAALNLKRPVVAVHGPPGSGKTHLLAEYLHALRQQGKRVLVLSKSNAGLYHLMGTFCKKFPSAASHNGTFIFMKRFDRVLASKVIADEAVERLIVKNSLLELQRNKDKKTQKFYDKTKILKSAMEKRQDLREDDLMREAEKVSEQMREISHQKRDEATKNVLKVTSILFTNTSYSMLNLFTRIGLTFDVVIIDDAAKLSQFDSWWMALSTAPIIRLFGDYNQSEATVASLMGRELNFGKSLLQRLDEQFGPEKNFHLRRQYRSNAAIQAWPNRAFYGQRAAEPDKSVRNIRLDDLLGKGKSAPPELITDPMVLVDLGQLEGEWRDGIFKAEERGNSWLNWGEAFLTASHIWHLFEHIPRLCPSKIAYSNHHNAQRNLLWEILSALYGRHYNNLRHIRMEGSENIHGQQFDVVIKDSVNVPPPEVFTENFHLKRLNNEICRARRQFIWFANSKWLEEGSEQSRQLLQTFHEYGRIIGPDQMPQLQSDQFWKYHMEVLDRCRQMHEQRMMMRTNKF